MKLWISPTEYIEVGRQNIRTLLAEIATRKNAQAFSQLNLALPDPDPVLKKQRKDISVYRDLLADAHVWACVQSRKSGVMGLEWEIDRGKAKSRLAKFIQDLFEDWDIYQVMSDILEAPLYGYQPIEVVWEKVGSYLLPTKVEAKPPEWFQFDSENQLRYAPPYQKEAPYPGAKKDNIGYFLPPYKFLLPRYNATYYNPYGERILARVFWPVTFKKGGLKFWVIFAEKYGMPYIIGKHPRGIGDQEIQKLADTLDAMIQDAVAAIPDDSSIELVEAAGKSGSADVYRNLIELCNAEISKAILGQTLTTEVGSRGSYAASKTHFDVRQDIIDADKRLVENTLNQLIRWIVEINFGGQTPPRFILYQEEEVDKTLAERDQVLANTGLRFTKNYFMKAYGFEEDDIEMGNNGNEYAETRNPKSEIRNPKSTIHNQKSEIRNSTDPQQVVDELLDALGDDELQEQMEDMLEPVLKQIQSGKDYNEILENLAAQYPKMNTDKLMEFLQRAIFISEIWGRLNANS